MEPLGKSILIKPYPPKETTIGGLVIPESCRERSCMAEVVGLGWEVEGLKKGDTIHHIKGAGVEVELDGEKLYIINQAEVLGCE